MKRYYFYVLCLVIALSDSPLFSQICLPGQPFPLGVTDRPLETLDLAEYLEASGCVPLQGARSKVKYAPVMFSTQMGGVANFETMLFVHNPDSNSPLSVEIDLFDSMGNLVNTESPVTIQPNGNVRRSLFQLQSADVYGMVRVRTLPDSQVKTFVGVTVYSADAIANPYVGSEPPIELDEPMASVQPLQTLQRKTGRLSMGPFSIRLDSNKDVFNGNFTLINIVNPNQAPLNLTAVIESSNGGAPQVVALPSIPPNGGFQFFDVWLRAINNYLNFLPGEEVTVTFVTPNGLPYVAESLIFDYLADGPSPLHLIPGRRARMTSIMPAYSIPQYLVCPEMTEVENINHGTVVSLTNISSVPATQVRAWYYNENGGLIGRDLIGNLNRLDVAQIGRNCPDSPNYPLNVFRGWIRITKCSGSLIGYSNRFNESPLSNQKMWGEVLHGNAGAEHSRGWLENGRRNIIAPLVFECDEGLTESNYMVFVNDNVSNIGNWEIDVFSNFGFLDGSVSFSGLRSFNTAGSYFDNFVSVSSAQPHAAFVRNDTGFVRGNNVIGGELVPKVRFGEGSGTYKGPGDTVPF